MPAGGHVVERLGRLLERHEQVVVDGIPLTVVVVDETRISALRA